MNEGYIRAINEGGMGMDPFEEASARRLYEELRRHPVELHLTGYSAWVLLSAIQLAVTHPGLGPELKGRLEKMGRTIQKTYDGVPWVAVIAEAGWHRAFDRPIAPPAEPEP